jgi:hypothetical protein
MSVTTIITILIVAAMVLGLGTGVVVHALWR